ncbi:eec09304-bc5d-48c9-9b00-ced93689fa13 [Sclerotinia trifoliorum]|uniref:Eec09304-bc5d-48c9-9b00-ced93689fa13 n=1 Tax=Sclerotinia trifoliorum TaxID=28548 RepID=A0A8H2ZQ34_9HELO|nr:eec09304-bc5d-48c9-9b00-ced93689fa13 [Sclerotinia trifoliorum]
MATLIPVSEASSTAYKEAIWVPIASYEVAARKEMNLSPTRERDQFPVERPLSTQFINSSCSSRAYVPMPFNTPRTALRQDSNLPKASSNKGEEKLTFKKVAPHLHGDGLAGKAHLRGGGIKRRRGGAAGRSFKKSKSDKFADVDQLLSDSKSPIFKGDANIKAVLTHPMARETMVDQGAPYPFDQMNANEVATTVADFKSDGTCGRFDLDWIAQAIEASRIRASGGYDAYLNSRFAENWGEDDEGVSDEEMEDVNDEAKHEKVKEKD